MLQVLKIPAEKLSDKLRARVADNMTTVRREIGRPITVGEVRGAIREGFAASERVRLEERDFSDEELADVLRLEKEKYLQASWIHRLVPSPDTNGRSIRKTPQGLLRLYVALAGEHIKDISITGDFAEDAAVAALEKRLASARADEAVIRDAVAAEGLPAEFAAAILDAVADAHRSDPYGCFLDAR
jgi:lipoate-protein ligase A